jgi:hypothetical protein
LRNPLRVERIPDDQQQLEPTDKLVPTSYVKWEGESKHIYPQRYFKVVRNETFGVSKARHVEIALGYGIPRNSLGRVSYILLHTDDSRQPLRDDSVLWDLVGDATVMQVSFPVHREHMTTGVLAGIPFLSMPDR